MKNKIYFLMSIILILFASYSFGQDSTATDLTKFNKNEFHSALLNGISLTMFCVYMVYGFFGIIANLVSDFVRRVPKSTTSPENFSAGYWWNDNKKRLLASILFLPLGIILCNDIFGWQISVANAFFIGLGADHGAEILKRKNLVVKGIQDYAGTTAPTN